MFSHFLSNEEKIEGVNSNDGEFITSRAEK